MKGSRIRSMLLIAAGVFVSTALWAQSAIVKDFKEVCDSLTPILQQKTGVYNELKIKSIMKRGSSLDFYFTESLGDFPWYGSAPQDFKSLLKTLFPEKYRKYQVGEIFSRGIPLNRFVTPMLGFDGTPSQSGHSRKEPGNGHYLVRNLDRNRNSGGMDGRIIALWQSHGRYYNLSQELWEWQRPCLFHTVEDMFTQSFVTPFLVPMLENAGAYVIMPRERDFRKEEIIVDNDASWHDGDSCGEEYGYGINGPARTTGIYSESRQWKDAGTGFADPKAVYSEYDNPFTLGTARKAVCKNSEANAPTATWTPQIEASGDYAVYVTYRSLPESSKCAHYIVRHAGGISEFAVNQQIGGGMWIYLGTFPFEKGTSGSVTLQADTPDGFRHVASSVVCADAVRFGGGMGNIERNGEVSGLPRNAEAARYFLQWCGADSTIYSPNNGENDYKDDFMSRGDWSAWLSGGSDMNPKSKGKGIPIDLTFGFHSDAGVTPNDSIVGTLAIYTYKSEGSTKLPSGENRMTSREYSDLVQSQIVNDLREHMTPLWSRRQTWDRGYRESRTPTSPSMLLELLSHQNFGDMKYGMDPEFRFIVSRAIYKGMLKYLSNRYGIPYIVQPLPVNSMAVRLLSDQEVEISWKTTKDEIEPTAIADGFKLYTRVDAGAFDTGRIADAVLDRDGRFKCRVKIEKGHLYSWEVRAYNNGGLSFPSERLSAGLPYDYRPSENGNSDSNSKDLVLIVNNFDRISAPAFFDSAEYAGFDEKTDRGVGYIREIAYIGDMSNYARGREWLSNANPGFGASYSDYAGNALAGNTFDYPAVHGKAILKTGHPFVSCSAGAFCTDSATYAGAWSIDLICGKQITTWKGPGRQKYTIFPDEMQKAIEDFTSKGGHLLVSGSNIGTDIWDRIYPIEKDSLQMVRSQNFAKRVLGYKWLTNHADRNGKVRFTGPEFTESGKKTIQFHTSPNPECYCVESPDGIAPSSSKGSIILRYSSSGIPAGVSYEGSGYKTVCLGFPIETLSSEEDIDETISLIFRYFKL